jgi:hypothetical protein
LERYERARTFSYVISYISLLLESNSPFYNHNVSSA